jgi:tRNA-specific 2-thiouridylase
MTTATLHTNLGDIVIEMFDALEGRVRYRDPRVAITFTPEPDGSAHIEFREPQRALASGQIFALYEGERLLGGSVYR